MSESAADAAKRQKDEEARLAAIARGWDVVVTPLKSTETISEAITEFMDEYRIGKKPKTVGQMRDTLDVFQQVCKERQKRLLSDVTKKDLMAYWQWALDHSPTKSRRTASNKTYRVNSFLVTRDLKFLGKAKNQWQVPTFLGNIFEKRIGHSFLFPLQASRHTMRSVPTIALSVESGIYGAHATNSCLGL